MSTRVVARAAATTRKARERLRQMVPIGPMKVRLSPVEMLTVIDRIGPQGRMQLAGELGGPEALLGLVQRLRQRILDGGK